MSYFDGASTYVISDLHINHTNLCKGISKWDDTGGCRDFDSLEDMNNAIFSSINSKVKKSDTLIVIGDILFGDKTKLPTVLESIKCKNIWLIRGNHDDFLDNPRYRHHKELFVKVLDYMELTFNRKSGGKKKCVAFHYPMKVWNGSHKGFYALTGHSHGSLPYEDYELGLDMGWDVWKEPLSLHEIDEILSKKKWEQVDHHGPNTN